MSRPTNVYVDGFNFYYGCVKDTPYKWLDFRALCRQLLNASKHDIRQIKYFTARVDGRGDPHRPTRQDAYLRAIQSADPQLSVILGHFLTNETTLPRADGRGAVRVLRTEEKGSDVNLATHLLHDAFTGAIECAVLVTNDSDLVEPVRIVRKKAAHPRGNPVPYRPERPSSKRSAVEGGNIRPPGPNWSAETLPTTRNGSFGSRRHNEAGRLVRPRR